MQSTSEQDTRQCIVPEDTDLLEFIAGNITVAYSEIRRTVKSKLHNSPSLRVVQGHVLKGLLRQYSVLTIEDVLELRVLIDVDVTDNASVDEMIASVLEEAAEILAAWLKSQDTRRGTSA